jgi:hypothetical protein
MKTKALEVQNGALSKKQLKTFKKFRQRLSDEVPEYRIVWVRSYNERIIEVGLETQKKIGYRKMLQAAKVVSEVEDEMNITIVPG